MMDIQDRKRKIEFIKDDDSSSASVMFIKASRTHHVASPNPAAKPKLESAAKVKLESTSSKTSSSKAGTNIDIHDSVQEIKSLAESSEQLVRILRKDSEEWKEQMASRAQDAVKTYESRLLKAEEPVHFDEIEGLPEKIMEIQESCRTEIGDVMKVCRNEFDTRLQGFADHMMSFFSQNPSHIITKNATRTNPSSPDFVKGKETATPTEMKSEKSEKSEGDLPSSTTEATAATTGGLEGSEDPFATLGLSRRSYIAEPRLTNKGYQSLLKHFNFKNIAQLEALSQVDNIHHIRDCYMFCDISSPNSNIDYILRIGGSASLFMDTAPSVSNDHHPDLMNTDLSKLRIFKLELSVDHLGREEIQRFKEWKDKYDPPSFVYELGQLFIQRVFKRSTRVDMFSTVYNVLMDVSKRQRPVWLALRPGCPVDQRRKRNDNRDSTLAFNGMNKHPIARLTKDMDSLCLTWKSTDLDSYAHFLKAQNTVMETGCNVDVELRAKGADIVEMVSAIAPV